MRKILRISLFLAIVFISSITFKYVYAQQTPLVEFDINNTEVQISPEGYYYYNLSGWWEPKNDGDYYFILQYENTKVDLCVFKNSTGGSHFNLEYPNCNGLTSGYLVEHGHDYRVYFSDTSKGEPVSSCYSSTSTSGSPYCDLDDVPEVVPVEEHNVFKNWDVTLHQSANEYYYDIKADVISGETGTVEVVLRRTDGTGEISVLHPSFNLSGNKSLSVSTKDGGTVKLRKGEYKITVNYKNTPFDSVIQTYVIGTKVPSSPGNNSGNNGNNGNNRANGNSSGVGSGSAAVGGVNPGDGLVSTKCGYDNGPMCNFTDLMSLLNRIINYIFVLVLPIAAIIFAYAGYLFIVSAGDPKKREAAKNAMTKLVIGIVIIMLAWIIVKTILVTLGVEKGFRLLDIRD